MIIPKNLLRSSRGKCCLELKKIPSVSFIKTKCRLEGGLVDIRTDQLFIDHIATLSRNVICHTSKRWKVFGDRGFERTSLMDFQHAIRTATRPRGEALSLRLRTQGNEITGWNNKNLKAASGSNC
ncbi:hypothetical protein EVAR_8351_1 [Eumeta japonica]|uniref:Uncharacterized protein n=1 Tax=Eumeta variegata TaxID=151549 RepID=A0A4C1VBJ6_EUMVA|nr:hypothetical protein EVAR_8351_1 [Eumeta japonica]